MANPVITFSSPASGATVSGTIAVTATVTDDLGVREVTARASGLTLPGGSIGGGGTANQSFTFNTAYRKRPRCGIIQSKGYIKPGAGIPSFANFRTGSGPDKYDASCTRFMINLDGFNTTDHLPSSVNTWLDNYFAALREGGVSCAFGIVYYNPNEPSPFQPEPSLIRIRNHLEDLKPTVAANIDMVDEFYAAIVGDWGEQNFWRGGTSFVGNASESFLGLLRTALHEIWGDLKRHFMWRNLRNLFEQPETTQTGWYTRGANASEAYRFELPIALDAIHIDSAMNGGPLGDELSSYYPFDVSPTSITKQKQRQYMREVTLYTPTYREGGGPANDLNPPDGFTKRGAIDYLKDYNVSKFNYDGFTHIDLWLSGSSPENDEWRRTVGYNLHMRSYDIRVNEGTITITIQWENLGSAGIHNHVQLYLELGNQLIKLSDDIRMETPRGGGISSKTYTVTRPAGLTAGSYAIKFWLPDKDVQASAKFTGSDSEKAAKRAKWAIPLSSNGFTFETANGRNNANRNLVVTNTGSSDVYVWQFDTTLVTDGGHTITLTASDFDGGQTIATRNIIVDNIAEDLVPPVLNWINPTEGQTLSGEINIEVSATDALSGMQRVDFFINNVFSRTVSVSPFRAAWDTTRENNGGHVLKALAYDRAGNVSEKSITVITNNTGTVAGLFVIKPNDNETLSNISLLDYSKTGDVIEIRIYLDGDLIHTTNATLAGPRYIYQLDTTTFSDGQYTLLFQAETTDSTLIDVTRTIFIDNFDPTPTSVYSMRIYTPQRSPVEGRTADAGGLVAEYDNNDFYYPKLQQDNLGNVTAGSFQAIPKNQDGTQRLDIRKNDIVQFFVGAAPTAIALIDVPVNAESKGAGILEDVDTYEIYRLKNAMELLEQAKMPDVEYFNDIDPDTGETLATKRTIYQLASLICARHLPRSIPVHSITEFSTKRFAPFWAPGSTVKAALEAVIASSGKESVKMWIDPTGRLQIDHRKTTLGLNPARVKKRNLPHEPGRLITEVNLQIFGDNKFPEAYKPEIYLGVLGDYLASEESKYNPGLIEYSYADPLHEIYEASITRAVVYLSEMEFPVSEYTFAANNPDDIFNADDLRRLITNPEVNATPVKNIAGRGVINNPSIAYLISYSDNSYYGARLKYSFLEDLDEVLTPFTAIRITYNYYKSNNPVAAFYIDLPFTGTRSGGVEGADTGIQDLSFRFLPPRGAQPDQLIISLEFFGLTETLGGDPQAILYNFHPLRIDKRPGSALESVAKRGIVLPQIDPGEIIITASDDIRVNQPIPGLVPPIQILNLNDGETIESKEIQTVETSYDTEFQTVLRWGRKDVDNELTRGMKYIKSALDRETNQATLTAVRRGET